MNAVSTQRDVFRHVEAELYAYPFRKKEIQRLREEVLSPHREETDENTVKGANSARMPGDPTGRAAVALTGHARLLHLERVADAIEQVYGRMPERMQEFVKVKYWTQPQKLTTVGICDKLGISDRSFSRWRSQLVNDVAEILGWR